MEFYLDSCVNNNKDIKPLANLSRAIWKHLD